MSRNLDKIVLDEEATAVRNKAYAIGRVARAIEALRWFAEYAVEKAPGSPPSKEVLRMNVDVIASATPNVKSAQEYVKRAAAEFEQKILARAIALAWADRDDMRKSLDD